MNICQNHQQEVKLICSQDMSLLCVACIPGHSKDHQGTETMMNILDIQDVSTDVTIRIQMCWAKMDALGRKVSAITVDQMYKQSGLQELKQAMVSHVRQVFQEIKGEFIRLGELEFENYREDLQCVIDYLSRTKTQLSQMLQLDSVGKAMSTGNKDSNYYAMALDKQASIAQHTLGQLQRCLPFEVHDEQQLKKAITQVVFKSVSRPRPVKENSNEDVEETPTAIIQKCIPKQHLVDPKHRYVPKKKKCQSCSQPLEYLTDLKKHLVCRTCGNKERNYVKRG